MTIIGQTARRSTRTNHRSTVGAVGSGRRKLGAARGRTRALKGGTVPSMEYPDYGSPLREGGYEELDPAFDEFGALSDHLDGLSGHLRIVSTHAGRDESWDFG